MNQDTWTCKACSGTVKTGDMHNESDCAANFASLRAALAAEREAHARTQKWLDDFQGETAAKVVELAAERQRNDEHHAAAMAMSEKHRRNWVEACQERDALRAQVAKVRRETLEEAARRIEAISAIDISPDEAAHVCRALAETPEGGDQ